MICGMLSSHLWYQKTSLCQKLVENWLTDLAFLVDLTTHLNELNMCLQGENQFINTIFQTMTAFPNETEIMASSN